MNGFLFMSLFSPGFAIGIGTFALGNAGLGQHKEGNGLGWFFASLLIVAIALLLVAALNKVKAK